MAPGKTAPRLLQDLLTYDPRHEERAGRNLLTSPPPQYDAKGPKLPAVPVRNCRHNLFTKNEQSQLPVAGEDPGHGTTYKVASYCNKCRWHVDVTVDHTKNGPTDKPCGKGNTDYALHHFCYVPQDDSDTTNGLDAQLRRRTYTFYCSAQACPVIVVISFKPPRFSAHDVESLTNQAQLRRRWEAAKQLAGDRADVAMARKVDAPDYLNTYLQDSLKPTKGKARIPLLNKKFLKTFGRDCDSILKSLGFENHQEEDSDGTISDVWYLPKPDEPASPLDSTLRNTIEDARYELNTIILDMPESERAGCRHTPMWPTPSRGDLERALACVDYAKVKGRETRSTAEEDHPFYAGLGALGDFDDALILFAYSRQSAEDVANSGYYFECLQDLASGRQSEMLEMQVAVLASKGITSQRDLNRAYQYFNIDPGHAHVISDEHIIGCFRARLSDISPLQADEARKQLRVLGDARESDKIRAEASDSIETYEQAMAWFELDSNASDDFVQTMYSLKTQDSPTSLETAQKALSIIAETRNSERLRNFLKFGTVTEPEMDLGEAYALFNLPDRNIAIDLAVAGSQLALETGDRSKHEKAYALILQDQAERFNNRPDDPNLVEARRNNYPLETWPVGLRNIGNTCYLNSVLQFLFTVKPLRDLILNCEEYMQDPSPEALKGKIVGRSIVTPDRVLTAQTFVRELRTFYERMITAPTDTVQPKIDLASLALCKTDYSAVASQSPTMGATEGTSLGTIDGTAVSGPMLPPPSGNTKPTIPEGPAATNGDANSVASMDSVIGGADAEITPADSVMNDDGGAQANGMTTITTGDENDVPVAPTRPPPVPPRPEQQPEQKPTEKPVTPTKPKPKPKISSIEESARQQDAAEVMANIFDLIRCAIKGDEILREGEQGDAVKKIFFSDVTTVLEDAEGIKKNRESRNHLLVSTGQRDRSLYAVLDDDFGKDEKEDGAGTRYDYIEKAAPFQIINVKRIQFNRRQKQLVYDYSHIGLDTTMYMDRYMSETPTLGEAQLLELRQAQWAKQNELRELDERRKKLQTTGIEGMTLPDCLEAACEFVDDLRAEKEPGQDSLPTPPPELAASLHERAKYLAKDLEAIDPQIAQLESEIDTVFRDCRSVPYRLHAVFTHRGSIKGGHYWIYIYDFQNKKWRKYNDEYVEDVEEGVVLAKQEGERPQVSTGMVYIRADLVEEVTQAVCRRPEPVAVEESGDMDVDMRDIWEDEEDQVPALEPVDMGNVPVIEGVKKE